MKQTIFHKLWEARKFYFFLIIITLAITSLQESEMFSIAPYLNNIRTVSIFFLCFEVIENIFDTVRLKSKWFENLPLVTWIFRTRTKIWYFFHITLNYRDAFLRNLNRKLDKWELCGNGPDYYLQLSFTHPMLVGDEMFIRDPLIPLDNPADARYGYYYGTSYWDLPRNPFKLKALWKRALSVYKSLPVTTNYKVHCDYCAKSGSEYNATGIKGDSICPKCFGLSQIYHWGKQSEYGQKFINGSRLIWSKDGYLNKVIFNPEGLENLLLLYDHFGSGVVLDIVQEYLIRHAFEVISTTFPKEVIYYTYSEQPEQGLCDFVHDGDGKTWFRRFYLHKSNKYINLYSGNSETPSNEISLVTNDRHLPNQVRWNVTLDIFRNLCKFTK